jgi:YidC/Oxa1 family membrane protein insertase
MGPKEVDRLVALGGGAVHSIDLGWSWIAPMTRFFGWMLRALYSLPFLGNYGVAIVILTILVRVVTAPLVSKQMRSMEGMRGLQPKIKEVQEKHKDDRQKQSEEMMRLYKKEGVNPLGGCLPMVLQLPVMIGLFYALRSSIELREAPFFGWIDEIDDLSAPETLFMIPGLELPVRVLPLVMGGTMILQQKITPQPTMDATQARMMTTVMPIVMTFVFYQFASGLVLYWMLSNILAIAHQMWIRRASTKAAGTRKAGTQKTGRKRAESGS